MSYQVQQYLVRRSIAHHTQRTKVTFEGNCDFSFFFMFSKIILVSILHILRIIAGTCDHILYQVCGLGSIGHASLSVILNSEAPWPGQLYDHKLSRSFPLMGYAFWLQVSKNDR